jgi:hypothetical protein
MEGQAVLVELRLAALFPFIPYQESCIAAAVSVLLPITEAIE